MWWVDRVFPNCWRIQIGYVLKLNVGWTPICLPKPQGITACHVSDPDLQTVVGQDRATAVARLAAHYEAAHAIIGTARTARGITDWADAPLTPTAT